MSFSRVLKFNRYIFFANISIFIATVAIFILSLQPSKQNGFIEARRIVLKGENGTPSMILQGDNESALLVMNDSQGRIRLQLQGGAFPAIMIKNENQEIVGTFFPLKDGGTALGLGDAKGHMSTFLRGGAMPALSLYQNSNEPNITMGIADKLPHFIMFPSGGKEGLLIHGNAPTSLLFFDEKGEIPVSLSRYGLHQEKPLPVKKSEAKKTEKMVSSKNQE